MSLRRLCRQWRKYLCWSYHYDSFKTSYNIYIYIYTHTHTHPQTHCYDVWWSWKQSFSFFVQWYINFGGLLNTKAIFVEGHQWHYLTLHWRDKGAWKHETNSNNLYFLCYSAYIYIYIYIYIIYFGSRFSCWHILLKMTEKDLELSFLLVFSCSSVRCWNWW